MKTCTLMRYGYYGQVDMAEGGLEELLEDAFGVKPDWQWLPEDLRGMVLAAAHQVDLEAGLPPGRTKMVYLDDWGQLRAGYSQRFFSE